MISCSRWRTSWSFVTGRFPRLQRHRQCSVRESTPPRRPVRVRSPGRAAIPRSGISSRIGSEAVATFLPPQAARPDRLNPSSSSRSGHQGGVGGVDDHQVLRLRRSPTRWSPSLRTMQSLESTTVTRPRSVLPSGIVFQESCEPEHASCRRRASRRVPRSGRCRSECSSTAWSIEIGPKSSRRRIPVTRR